MNASNSSKHSDHEFKIQSMLSHAQQQKDLKPKGNKRASVFDLGGPPNETKNYDKSEPRNQNDSSQKAESSQVYDSQNNQGRPEMPESYFTQTGSHYSQSNVKQYYTSGETGSQAYNTCGTGQTYGVPPPPPPPPPPPQVPLDSMDICQQGGVEFDAEQNQGGYQTEKVQSDGPNQMHVYQEGHFQPSGQQDMQDTDIIHQDMTWKNFQQYQQPGSYQENISTVQGFGQYGSSGGQNMGRKAASQQNIQPVKQYKAKEQPTQNFSQKKKKDESQNVMVTQDTEDDRTYCEVCAVRFKKESQYWIHCRGLAHYHKVEEKERKTEASTDPVTESPDWALCEPCGMNFYSEKAKSLHVKTTSHILTMERLDKEKRKQQMAEVSKRVVKNNSWVPAEEKDLTPYNIGKIEDRDFFCEVCNIQCTGAKNLDMHLAGVKHIRMVELKEVLVKKNDGWAPPPDKMVTPLEAVKAELNDLFCEVCDIHCTGVKNFEMHLAGNKHMKKVKRAKMMSHQQEVQGKPGLMGQDPMGQNKATAQSVVQAAFDSCQEPIIGADYVTEYQKQDLNVEPRFACSLCQSKMDSRVVLLHLTGTKHRIKYLKHHYVSKYNKLWPMKQSEKTMLSETMAAEIEKQEGRRNMHLRIEIKSGSWEDVPREGARRDLPGEQAEKNTQAFLEERPGEQNDAERGGQRGNAPRNKPMTDPQSIFDRHPHASKDFKDVVMSLGAKDPSEYMGPRHGHRSAGPPPKGKYYEQWMSYFEKMENEKDNLLKAELGIFEKGPRLPVSAAASSRRNLQMQADRFALPFGRGLGRRDRGMDSYKSPYDSMAGRREPYRGPEMKEAETVLENVLDDFRKKQEAGQIKQAGEIVQETKKVEKLGDISQQASALLKTMGDCMVADESDAEVALQMSNALTQALLNYRLKCLPQEEGSTEVKDKLQELSETAKGLEPKQGSVFGSRPPPPPHQILQADPHSQRQVLAPQMGDASETNPRFPQNRKQHDFNKQDYGNGSSRMNKAKKAELKSPLSATSRMMQNEGNYRQQMRPTRGGGVQSQRRGSGQYGGESGQAFHGRQFGQSQGMESGQSEFGRESGQAFRGRKSGQSQRRGNGQSYSRESGQASHGRDSVQTEYGMESDQAFHGRQSGQSYGMDTVQSAQSEYGRESHYGRESEASGMENVQPSVHPGSSDQKRPHQEAEPSQAVTTIPAKEPEKIVRSLPKTTATVTAVSTEKDKPSSTLGYPSAKETAKNIIAATMAVQRENRKKEAQKESKSLQPKATVKSVAETDGDKATASSPSYSAAKATAKSVIAATMAARRQIRKQEVEKASSSPSPSISSSPSNSKSAGDKLPSNFKAYMSQLKSKSGSSGSGAGNSTKPKYSVSWSGGSGNSPGPQQSQATKRTIQDTPTSDIPTKKQSCTGSSPIF